MRSNTERTIEQNSSLQVKRAEQLKEKTPKSKRKMRSNTKQKKMCEKLLFYLKSPRFVHFINQYSTIADRDLFESEFVRTVWDKPDLTNDELNLYITVCTNYVRQKHIQQRIDRLNNMLNDTDNETLNLYDF